VPASTLAELIAFAKANPDKLSYASPGAGSPPHLAAAMLVAAAGVRMVHVPYQGLAPAMTDLLSGHVDMMFDNLGNTLPLIKEGRLRVFATSSQKRIPEFPDVPAVAEIYPDVVYTSWFAIVAPPKTPPEVAGQLSSAIAEVLRMPDVVNRLQAMSARPGGSDCLPKSASAGARSLPRRASRRNDAGHRAGRPSPSDFRLGADHRDRQTHARMITPAAAPPCEYRSPMSACDGPDTCRRFPAVAAAGLRRASRAS
jgi:hypothetical protein